MSPQNKTTIEVMDTVFNVVEGSEGPLYQLAGETEDPFTLQQAINYGVGEYLVRIGVWQID